MQIKDLLMKDIYYRVPKRVQTLGINIFELKEWNIRRSAEFKNWLTLLRKIDTWDEKEHIEYQNKHLKSILDYAYRNVPYYHNLYKKLNIDISKIKTNNDLGKLPIIKKEDIATNYNSFLSNSPMKAITQFTSGTTGKPLKMKIPANLVALDKANIYKRSLWAGCNKEWTARFVGDRPVKDCSDDRLFRKSYVLRRAIFPSYCLSFHKLPRIFEALKKMEIKTIQCYPSTGYVLAKFLELNDMYYPLNSFLYSSEPMFDFQRKLIADRFKTRLFGYYGHAEEAISALECECGNYHLTMINGILEVIDEHGNSLSQGEKGFAIVTSLHNYSMPLIRYALNDFTGFLPESCECGRKLPLISPIATKLDDFIITPSGKAISPSLLTFPLKHAKNILETQYIQNTIDLVEVKIVKSEHFSDLDELNLLNSIKKILGEEITIKFDYVKEIHQTKAHKKRFVINKLGGDYIGKALKEF